MGALFVFEKVIGERMGGTCCEESKKILGGAFDDNLHQRSLCGG